MSILAALLLCCVLMTGSTAWAEVMVQHENNDFKIEVRGETVGSVLEFFHREFRTTASLPESLANQPLDGVAKGSSLLHATQRLFRRYNSIIIDDGNGGVSHISLLPTNAPEDSSPRDGQVRVIGNMGQYNRQKYWMIHQSVANRWHGKRRSMPPHGMSAPYTGMPWRVR
ncbi:MAG: hypothetical protein D6698_12905 [Gammaproteobacteria bacterium]|nr:MAG: hypothetical protein D6698_12905 [Gammaproteobacteria bacterium]